MLKKLRLYQKDAENGIFEYPETLYYGEDDEFTKFEDLMSDDLAYYFEYGTVYSQLVTGAHTNAHRLYTISYAPNAEVTIFLEAKTTSAREAFLWVDDITKAQGNILPPDNETNLAKELEGATIDDLLPEEKE